MSAERNTTSPLISIEEARRRVEAEVPAALPAEDVPVEEALGRVLAEEVHAEGDVPPFPNAALDGFALADGPAGRSLRIAGEARAGHPAARPVAQGEAFRISTGAVLPEGATAVLPVERAAERDGHVTAEIALAARENVRDAGEDLRAGTAVLHRGAVLDPAGVGVAVIAGRAVVRCARRPRVGVLATGDELVPPGRPLAPGQIHNSNAVTLAALARAAGASIASTGHVPDDPRASRAALGAALEGADVLIVSGGVSVGPHDHVKPALRDLGVQERFWGVALRPGKPTWFGVGGGRLAFGLPGNPVSTMVCFLLFARPALLALQGAAFWPHRETAELAEAVKRNPHREEAVRVRLEPGPRGPRARSTGPQASHLLSSMLDADALAFVGPGASEAPAGTDVPIERI